MRIYKLNCPNCGGGLSLEINNDTHFVFCPYCGQKFLLDDEKKKNIINANVKFKKEIHFRHTEDAEVLKEIYKDKKDRRDNRVIFLCFLFLLAIPGIPWLLMNIHSSNEIRQGNVSAGFYRDLIDQDYQSVEAHFEAAGFTNIQLIDLDDSGIILWKDGKVKTISVGGDTNFDSADYFPPDTKVVISYH